MTDSVSYRLNWPEYTGVALSLAVTLALSFRFYGEDGKKWTTAGSNRPSMPLLAIALSLIASATTGVSLLGKPAESYSYGIDFAFFITVCNILHYCLGYFLFLPIILKLETVSIYEYFDLRFNGSVRKLVSVPYVIVRILNSSLAVIPPVIVIHQFSGIDETLLMTSLLLLTTFYTMIGGFRGVVWADAFQSIVMFLTMISLTILSVIKVGGVDRVITVAYQTNRLDIPSLNFDPTERISFWTYGTAFSGLSIVVLNQSIYQRLKSLSTEKEVKRALAGHVAGIVAFLLTATFVGLAIYTYYDGCDPKAALKVKSYPDVVVYWANEIGQSVAGIRGLYIAGVTCASISTMSTHLNTVAEMICENKSKRASSPYKIRLATLGVGSCATLIAVLIRNSGSLVELSFTFNSLEGIASGLFLLGALCVPANAKGALIGGSTSLMLFLLVIIGSRVTNAGKALKPLITKPVRTNLCPNVSSIIGNRTMIAPAPSSDVFFLFKLSPFSIGPMLTATTIAIGVGVSYLWPSETELNVDLLSPIVHRFLKKRRRPDDVGDKLEGGKDHLMVDAAN